MNIIITGGSGYIGSKLVPYLAGLGHNITVIDRCYFGNNLWSHPNVELREVDIFDTTADDYFGYDAIVHLAGLSNDPMANFNPADNYIQNLAATSFLAYAAKQARIDKFIFAGSCSVYGRSNEPLLTEQSIAGCDFPYGLSKLQAEHSLMHLSDDRFKIVMLRQATVFGWAPRMRTDLVVNTMTKTAVLENKIYVNAPTLCRPLIHIDDLCRVYGKVLENDVPQVMNVSMHNFTLLEIAEQVKDALKDQLPGLTIENKNISDLRSYHVDNSLMQQHLGKWEPVSVGEAVKNLVAHIPVTDKETWADPSFLNIEIYKQRFTRK